MIYKIDWTIDRVTFGHAICDSFEYSNSFRIRQIRFYAMPMQIRLTFLRDSESEGHRKNHLAIPRIRNIQIRPIDGNDEAGIRISNNEDTQRQYC